MKKYSAVILKKGLPVIAGATLGYLYYYFIGCQGGTCPITSNPYISSIYGGIIGLIIVSPNLFKKNVETEKNKKRD